MSLSDSGVGGWDRDKYDRRGRGGNGATSGPGSICFSICDAFSYMPSELGFVGLLRMIDSVDVNGSVPVPPDTTTISTRGANKNRVRLTTLQPTHDSPAHEWSFACSISPPPTPKHVPKDYERKHGDTADDGPDQDWDIKV